MNRSKTFYYKNFYEKGNNYYYKARKCKGREVKVTSKYKDTYFSQSINKDSMDIIDFLNVMFNVVDDLAIEYLS